MSSCRICFSPYRHEIELLSKKGVPLTNIAKKFSKILGIPEKNLYNTIKSHIRNKHAEKVSPNTGAIAQSGYPSSLQALERIDFETVAQSLLEQGVRELQQNESALTTKDKIILATKLEKTNLDRKKVDLGESNLKLQIAKLFGGFVDPPKKIEDGNK